jgi:Flp pilus assembly protein TadG
VITTKLVRLSLVVIVLAIAAVAALEVHWSMTTKDDARGTAQRAATASAHLLFTSHVSLAARHTAEEVAAAGHTHLDSFTIRTDGVVHITVSTRAKSYVLRRIPMTRSVSEVTVGADAIPQ